MQLITAIDQAFSWRNDQTREISRVMRCSHKARSHQTISKTIRLSMKLTAALLFVFSLHVAARSDGQTITLSVRNASMEQVFKQIKKQSGYSFIYGKDLISRAEPVSISVKNEPLQEVLDLVFQNQPLAYKIADKYIIISPKPTPLLQSRDISVKSEPPPPIDVRGRVVNEKGEPVIATVSVKGTKQATSTNENGEFELKDIDEDATLVISGVSIETFEIKVNGRNQLPLNAKIKMNISEEVVINKGYYSVRQKENTGSVTKVPFDAIENQPVANPIAALQGLVPGLTISQGNGLPGSNFSVNIRGRNSIQSGLNPLYVIDGVPFMVDHVSQRGASYNANNPLNTINPLDIESIEILKDADAAAIYGSRGANGVILITTKKGKVGKTTVEGRSKIGFGCLTRNLQYLNTAQYLQVRREAFSNDGVSPTAANAADLLVYDTTRYTDFKKLLFGGTAKVYNSQIRISGGNMYTHFSLSVNYYKETTVVPGNFGEHRVSASSTLSHTTNDKRFQLNFTNTYGNDYSFLPNASLTSALNLPPDLPPLYDSLGRLNWKYNGVSFSNPLAYLLQPYEGRNERFTSDAVFSYRIGKVLSAKVNLGYNKVDFTEFGFNPISAQNPAYNPKGSNVFGGNKFQTWIIEPQLEYNSSNNKNGALTVLIGSTFQENDHDSYIISGANYQNDALLRSMSGAGSISSSNSSAQYKYEAIYSRINYNWLDKYIVNLTGRTDGSSRFGPRHQFGSFGAVGAAWIFSEEKKIVNIIPVLSFGKLRGSYGITGNDQIGDYQYLDTWSSTQYPYQSNPSLRPVRIFNSNFGWERNRKLELALELGLFEDRFSFSANWYRNESDNQLISYTLPAQTGFTSLVENFPGKIENRSWELSMAGKLIRKKAVSWNTELNFTIPKNVLKKFPDIESSSYATSYIVGKPLNSNIGYRYLGVDTQTGVYTYADENHDNILDFRDYVFNGTTDPKFYGGVNNQLQIQNWQLDFLFSFARQLGSDPLFRGFTIIGSQQNLPISVLDRWQKPGDVSRFEKYSQSFGTPATSATLKTYQSGAWLTDASFIRLRNIHLAYKFSENWNKNLNIKACSIYLEGQNLFTITKYAGADPETQGGLMPPLRLLTGGIQIVF